LRGEENKPDNESFRTTEKSCIAHGITFIGGGRLTVTLPPASWNVIQVGVK
jgi:hypothetical protein